MEDCLGHLKHEGIIDLALHNRHLCAQVGDGRWKRVDSAAGLRALLVSAAGAAQCELFFTYPEVKLPEVPPMEEPPPGADPGAATLAAFVQLMLMKKVAQAAASVLPVTVMPSDRVLSTVAALPWDWLEELQSEALKAPQSSAAGQIGSHPGALELEAPQSSALRRDIRPLTLPWRGSLTELAAEDGWTGTTHALGRYLASIAPAALA